MLVGSDRMAGEIERLLRWYVLKALTGWSAFNGIISLYNCGESYKIQAELQLFFLTLFQNLCF